MNVTYNDRMLAEDWAAKHGYPAHTTLTASFAELVALGRMGKEMTLAEMLESERNRMDITALVSRAYNDAVKKGWYENGGGQNVPERLCLIHSEVSEALECWRDGDMKTVCRESDGKPEGFPSEIADVCIRLADLCGFMGIDLEAEITKKMAFNATREHRHGGKRA